MSRSSSMWGNPKAGESDLATVVFPAPGTPNTTMPSGTMVGGTRKVSLNVRRGPRDGILWVGVESGYWRGQAGLLLFVT